MTIFGQEPETRPEMCARAGHVKDSETVVFVEEMRKRV